MKGYRFHIILLLLAMAAPQMSFGQGGCTIWIFGHEEHNPLLPLKEPCLTALLATKGSWSWKAGCSGVIGDLWLATHGFSVLYWQL